MGADFNINFKYYIPTTYRFPNDYSLLGKCASKLDRALCLFSKKKFLICVFFNYSGRRPICKRNTKMLIVSINRMNEINRKSTDFKLFFPVTLLRKWM